jgi:5-methylcytosine-specific restriction endonuclease McrBC GTP-binding regulatory subunit McrB
LYQMLDKSLSDNQQPRAIQYWLYSLGEKATYWDEFYNENIMALGWDALGDLMEYEGREAIQKELQKGANTTKLKYNDTTANDDFRSRIQVDDIIFVKRGRGELLGYGIVKSDYYFDDTRPYYKHCREVEWEKRGVWKTDHSLVVKTLTDITNYKTENPNFNYYYQTLFAFMNETMENKKNDYPAPLNQILYGPPGTGKTYSTIELAYRAIKGDSAFEQDGYDFAKQWFKDELDKTDSEDRQLDFITFHQNYSYEDFIMGIKPNINKSDGLSFNRHEGIFYKICQRALRNLKQSSEEFVNSNSSIEEVEDELEDINTPSEQSATAKPSFEKVFAELMRPLNDGQQVLIKMVRKNAFFKIYKIDGNSVFYYQQDGGSRDLSIKIIKELYENDGQYNSQGKGVYYNPLNEELHKLANPNYTRNVQQPKYFQDNSFPKNYVIIIDEINRANISRVFGELITLIEEDKRWGNDHAMEVRLPDGYTPFTVPKNLYIIGTMNTADKSIALLDIALRRRFEFTALYPDSSKVTAKYRTFFEALNEQIIAKKGIDFTIGHSYFMPKDGKELNFVNAMNKKVIPLLNEYFYNAKSNKVVAELVEKAIAKAELSNTIFSNDFQLLIQ